MMERPVHLDENQNHSSELSSLVLMNDNITTFDHVIKSLVEICGHDSVQAEQCALIVHFKGSCEVKTGQKEILSAMSRSLNAKGLLSKVALKSAVSEQ
jgi:ATP-dependent Clp protease adaptor protein ClpS